jgi:hypothetical protein
MKKTLFISLALLAGVNLTQARQEAAVPYYMTNTDSSKRDAIKTNQASGQSCGCCSNSKKTIVPEQEFINLKNATVQKTSAEKALITVVAKN